MSSTFPLVFTKTGHPGSVRVLLNNTESLSPAGGPVFSCQTLDVRCCMLHLLRCVPATSHQAKFVPEESHSVSRCARISGAQALDCLPQAPLIFIYFFIFLLVYILC